MPHPVFRRISAFLVLLLCVVGVAPARAEQRPQTPQGAPPPPGLLRESLAAALATKGEESPALPSTHNGEYHSPDTTPLVGRYRVDNSFGTYPNLPRGTQQPAIDAGIRALSETPVNTGGSSSAAGSGQALTNNTQYYASVDPAVLAAALRNADQASAYTLDIVNAVNGGNWNQFLGPITPSTSWGANLQDPLIANFGGSPATQPTIDNVLGFAAAPPATYGPPLLARLNTKLYAPWKDTFLDGRTPLERRYLEIEQAQLARYYSDEDLSGMRVELNQFMLFYVYTDPYYLYWKYELDAVVNQLRVTRPSYPAYVALASEIAAWTDAPADGATLRERYAKRFQLNQLRSQVEYEALALLAQSPGLAQAILDTQLWLSLRLSLNLSQPDVTLWYAGWLQRWRGFVVAASAPERQDFENLKRDYPALGEYVKLNQEVVQLLPSFSAYQVVQENNALGYLVRTDQNVAQSIATSYSQYRARVEPVLTSSDIPQQLETYYERLNGLVQRNAEYRQLQQDYTRTALALAQHQERVHNAVGQCIARAGAACNAYLDPAVIALMVAPDTISTIGGAGSFFERYTRFWSTLYTTPEYKQLEVEAVGRIRTAFGPILPQLETAQQTFRASVNSLPLVSLLRQKQTELVAILRGDTTSKVAGLPIADPSPELRDRLDRMAELARELRTSTASTAQPGVGIWLPLVNR